MKDARALRDALNVTCHEVGIDEVTMDEADELFEPHMGAYEFYTMAKSYFESMARVLEEILTYRT